MTREEYREYMEHELNTSYVAAKIETEELGRDINEWFDAFMNGLDYDETDSYDLASRYAYIGMLDRVVRYGFNYEISPAGRHKLYDTRIE